MLGSISDKRRRELATLLVLMPAAAIAEAISVAAIIPFLAMLTGQPAMASIAQPFERLFLLVERYLDVSSLAASAIAFGICVVATAILRLVLSWTSQQFAFGAGHEMAVEIQRRLLHQPYSFHLHRHSSEALASLDKVDHLVFNLLLQTIQVSSAAIVGLLLVGLLLAIDPVVAGTALLLVSALFWLAYAASRQGFARHSAQIGKAYETRLRAVQESVGAIRDVILDRSQEVQVKRFQAIDNAFMFSRARAAHLMAAPRIIFEAIGLLLLALLTIVIAGRAGGVGAALPVLGAIALGAYRLLPFMGQIYATWAHLSSSKPIMADVTGLLSLPLPDLDPDVSPMPFSSEIRFDQVSFLYPDRLHHALHDVSFIFEKGGMIAVTGHTGSGKSTLADLLMGLIRPSNGRILVDGTELTAARLAGWRKAIAHVPQSPFVADASIAANIALAFDGAQPDMDRVRRAAHIAQLDGFVEALPNRYDTRVGENGALLSGGQRQRLALARALYKQAPVLVLDEATSALDDDIEASVMAALDELRDTGCTIFVIAHRASTIASCDQVLTLKDGMLVESLRQEMELAARH